MSWHKRADEEAEHRSTLLLALQDGHLGAYTNPIHRFLLEEGAVRADLIPQYRRDLQEDWMLRGRALDRHRRSKQFMGRVAELQCAQWLEASGWKIEALEALGSEYDIHALSPSGQRAAIEVKNVGMERSDFSLLLRAIHDEPAAEATCPYSAINYLLLRVFEASQQLTDALARRVVLICVDEIAWWRFQTPLENAWIDWERPAFLDGAADWKDFYAKQVDRCPELAEDLRKAFVRVDELAILVRRRDGSFKVAQAPYGFEFEA